MSLHCGDCRETVHRTRPKPHTSIASPRCRVKTKGLTALQHAAKLTLRSELQTSFIRFRWVIGSLYTIGSSPKSSGSPSFLDGRILIATQLKQHPKTPAEGLPYSKRLEKEKALSGHRHARCCSLLFELTSQL